MENEREDEKSRQKQNVETHKNLKLRHKSCNVFTFSCKRSHVASLSVLLAERT